MTKKACGDLAQVSKHRGGCVRDIVRFFNFRRGVHFRSRRGSDRVANCNKDLSNQEIGHKCHGRDLIVKNTEEYEEQRNKSVRMLIEEEISRVEKTVQSINENKYNKSDENNNVHGEILVNGSSEELNLGALLHKIIDGNYREQKLQMNSENCMEMSIMASNNNDNAQSSYKLQGTSTEALETSLSNSIAHNDGVGDPKISLQSQEFLTILEILTSDENLSQTLLQDLRSRLEYIQHVWNTNCEELLTMEPCKEQIMASRNKSNGEKGNEGSSTPKVHPKRNSSSTFRREKSARPSARNVSHSVPSITNPPISRAESSSSASSSNALLRSTNGLRANLKKEKTVFHISLQEIKRRVKAFVTEREKQKNITSPKPWRRNWYGFHPINYVKSMQKKIIEAHLATLSSRKARDGNCLARIRSAGRQNTNSDEKELHFQRKAKKHIMETLNCKDGTIHLPRHSSTETLEKLFFLHEDRSSSSYDDRHKKLDSSTRPLSTSDQHACSKEVGISCIDSMLDVWQQSQDISDQSCVTTGSLNHWIAESSNLEDVPCVEAKSIEPADLPEMLEDDRSSQSQDSPTVKPELQSPRWYTRNALDISGTEDHDITAEKINQPSPLSVLVLPLLHDISSPESSTSEENDHGKSLLSPRQLQLEQHLEIDPSPLNPPERSKLSYLRSLLEASGLLHCEEWETLHRRRHCLLDPSLFDEVEPQGSESLLDLWLFFDRVGETIEEIYESLCLEKPWVRFLDPKIRPFPVGEDLMREIWRKAGTFDVAKDLRAVDEIVGGDLNGGRWVRAEEGVEEIGIAIGDEVLEEILEEAVAGMMVE